MKLCQPASSQSKTTQIRPSSLGSRKTLAPFEPCSLRFSAPLVEKVFPEAVEILGLRRCQDHFSSFVGCVVVLYDNARGVSRTRRVLV
jgi:hypothetical protein